MSDRTLKYRLGSIRQRAIESTRQPLPERVRAYLNGTSLDSTPLLAAETNDQREDRRRVARVALKSEVTVRRIGGFNFQVTLSNISAGGCNVELLEAAEVGDSVITRFPQLEPLSSRVCWIDGRSTGVEFMSHIHPAVLDLLVRKLAEGETAAA
jgi:hypothetical protein